MYSTSTCLTLALLLAAGAFAQGTEPAASPSTPTDFVTANWERLNDPAIQKRPPFNPGDPHPFVAPEDFAEWLEQLSTRAEEKLVEERRKSP